MTTATEIKPANDKERISALARYEILDTPADGNFDRISSLAAKLFNVPIAIVSLVDTDRIWFKSTFGLDVQQIERDPGLCASAILSDEVYVVENAKDDPRTLANPLVAGSFGLRFYAAAPLHTSDGYNLGTLCIIDRKQRYLTGEQRSMLSDLAGIVMDEMEMRLSARNTRHKIGSLLNDAAGELENAMGQLEKLPLTSKTPEIKTAMEASKKILKRINSEISLIN